MQTLLNLSNPGRASVCTDRKNPMTLEKKIATLIREATQNKSTRFDVVAHGLWGNKQGGYETNSSWYLRKDADIAEVLEAARGRWEVFKVTYLRSARVCDITDSGFDSNLSLEVDCIPFLEIRVSR